MPSLTAAQQNDLIKSLSRADLERLFSHLELVNLSEKSKLMNFGEKIDYTYFPGDAIVSLIHSTDDGATTEVGMVGREGVVGVSWFSGERANCDAVVQSRGFAYRIKAGVLRDLIGEGGALGLSLMRYTSALFVQVAQNVVGAIHSNLEQQVSRWLLDRLDRSRSNEMIVTQETIAQLLGVRRESVTGVACNLVEQELIACRRGRITVLDRDGLELVAGSCYRDSKAGFAQMSGQVLN